MKKVLQLFTLTTLLATSLSAAEIHDAAEEGNLALVKRLIKEDPTCVNARKDGGWTTLHNAAFNGHTEIVRLLIAYGADVNARNDRKRTPLYEAICCRGNVDVDMVRLLLSQSALVNVQTSGGLTPLHIAAYRGYVEVVRLLLACDADITIRNGGNETPYDFVRYAPVARRAEIIALFEAVLLFKSLRDFSAAEIVTV